MGGAVVRVLIPTWVMMPAMPPPVPDLRASFWAIALNGMVQPSTPTGYGMVLRLRVGCDETCCGRPRVGPDGPHRTDSIDVLRQRQPAGEPLHTLRDRGRIQGLQHGQHHVRG